MSEQSVPGDDAFTLSNEVEIRNMMGRLIEQQYLFTAHFSDDSRFFLTTVVGLSGDGSAIFLSVSPQESLNEQVLEATLVRMATQVDRHALRFQTGPLTLATFDSQPVFRAPLPKELQYLQWREFFRLTPPLSSPLSCQVPLGGAAKKVEEFRVIDISVGGVALSVPEEAAYAFQPGGLLPRCRIELPEVGVLEATLLVQHVVQTQDIRGQTRLSAGCHFHQPSAALQATLQRYITRVERERIARSQGIL